MRLLKYINANIIIIFIYKEIICRFKILKVLQSDKKIYFINKVIQKLIKKFKI